MHTWPRYAGSEADVSTAAQPTTTVGMGRMVLCGFGVVSMGLVWSLEFPKTVLVKDEAKGEP